MKSLPIVEMNEAIRVNSMKLITAWKEEAKDWVSILCPKMELQLKTNLGDGRHWNISKSNSYVYEVHCLKYRVMVNLSIFYCSCGEWSTKGFPCSHALYAIQAHGASPYAYVVSFFKVFSFR